MAPSFGSGCHVWMACAVDPAATGWRPSCRTRASRAARCGRRRTSRGRPWRACPGAGGWRGTSRRGGPPGGEGGGPPGGGGGGGAPPTLMDVLADGAPSSCRGGGAAAAPPEPAAGSPGAPIAVDDGDGDGQSTADDNSEGRHLLYRRCPTSCRGGGPISKGTSSTGGAPPPLQEEL